MSSRTLLRNISTLGIVIVVPLFVIVIRVHDVVVFAVNARALLCSFHELDVVPLYTFVVYFVVVDLFLTAAAAAVIVAAAVAVVVGVAVVDSDEIVILVVGGAVVVVVILSTVVVQTLPVVVILGIVVVWTPLANVTTVLGMINDATALADLIEVQAVDVLVDEEGHPVPPPLLVVVVVVVVVAALAAVDYDLPVDPHNRRRPCDPNK